MDYNNVKVINHSDSLITSMYDKNKFGPLMILIIGKDGFLGANLYLKLHSLPQRVIFLSKKNQTHTNEKSKIITYKHFIEHIVEYTTKVKIIVYLLLQILSMIIRSISWILLLRKCGQKVKQNLYIFGAQYMAIQKINLY